MKVSVSQYASALFDLVAGKSEKEVKVIIKNFVLLLDKNRDFNKLEAIIENFNDIWNKAHGELEATLLSARALPAVTQEKVISYLKDKTGVKKVSLDAQVNPDIVGGFILRYGSQVLDGSLKNSLDSLKNKISN